MPLKRLGKPPFLTPEDLDAEDVVEIVERPYIVPAEKTKWGRDRGKAVVQLVNGELRTWTMNITTWDRLVDAFGEDESQWIGKRVKIRKEIRNVSGVDKQVLFGTPYQEPQQQLPSQNKEIMDRIAKLGPEQKKALLEALKEET